MESKSKEAGIHERALLGQSPRDRDVQSVATGGYSSTSQKTGILEAADFAPCHQLDSVNLCSAQSDH